MRVGATNLVERTGRLYRMLCGGGGSWVGVGEVGEWGRASIFDEKWIGD